jgi:hypothetical protein
MGYPQPTIIKNKTIKPQQKAARLNRVPGPTRTRLARRSTSTALQLWLARGTPDGNASTAPRPVQRGTSTVLRLARGSFGRRENSDSHDHGSERSTHSIHLPRDKSQSI